MAERAPSLREIALGTMFPYSPYGPQSIAKTGFDPTLQALRGLTTGVGPGVGPDTGPQAPSPEVMNALRGVRDFIGDRGEPRGVGSPAGHQGLPAYIEPGYVKPNRGNWERFTRKPEATGVHPAPEMTPIESEGAGHNLEALRGPTPTPVGPTPKPQEQDAIPGQRGTGDFFGGGATIPPVDVGPMRRAIASGQPARPEATDKMGLLLNALLGATAGAAGGRPGDIGSTIAGAGAGALSGVSATRASDKARSDKFEVQRQEFAVNSARTETAIAKLRSDEANNAQKLRLEHAKLSLLSQANAIRARKPQVLQSGSTAMLLYPDGSADRIDINRVKAAQERRESVAALASGTTGLTRPVIVGGKLIDQDMNEAEVLLHDTVEGVLANRIADPQTQLLRQQIDQAATERFQSMMDEGLIAPGDQMGWDRVRREVANELVLPLLGTDEITSMINNWELTD